jgi:hypothetical protein
MGDIEKQVIAVSEKRKDNGIPLIKSMPHHREEKLLRGKRRKDGASGRYRTKLMTSIDSHCERIDIINCELISIQ